MKPNKSTHRTAAPRSTFGRIRVLRARACLPAGAAGRLSVVSAFGSKTSQLQAQVVFSRLRPPSLAERRLFLEALGYLLRRICKSP